MIESIYCEYKLTVILWVQVNSHIVRFIQSNNTEVYDQQSSSSKYNKKKKQGKISEKTQK